jgi:hypothetical protein
MWIRAGEPGHTDPGVETNPPLAGGGAQTTISTKIETVTVTGGN